MPCRPPASPRPSLRRRRTLVAAPPSRTTPAPPQQGTRDKPKTPRRLARILEQRIGPWLVAGRHAPHRLYPVAGNGSGTARPTAAWAAALHAGASRRRWCAPRSAYRPAPLAGESGLDGRLAASSNGFGPRQALAGRGPGEGTGWVPFARLGPSPVRVQRDHPYPSTAASANGLGAKGLTLLGMAGRGDRWQFEDPS